VVFAKSFGCGPLVREVPVEVALGKCVAGVDLVAIAGGRRARAVPPEARVAEDDLGYS